MKMQIAGSGDATPVGEEVGCSDKRISILPQGLREQGILKDWLG
jgi:hypothetical protein